MRIEFHIVFDPSIQEEENKRGSEWMEDEKGELTSVKISEISIE